MNHADLTKNHCALTNKHVAGRTNRTGDLLNKNLDLQTAEKSGYRGSTWVPEQSYEPKMMRGQYFWPPPFSIYFNMPIEAFWHPSLQVNCYSQKMIIIKFNTLMYLASKTREISIIQIMGWYLSEDQVGQYSLWQFSDFTKTRRYWRKNLTTLFQFQVLRCSKWEEAAD